MEQRELSPITQTSRIVAAIEAAATESMSVPTEYLQQKWYAAYTSANHEKRVAEQLAVQEINYFLPTYSSVRRWKDRRVTLQLPLFPGYVFVRLALRDRLSVLRLPGVAHFVEFNGKPVPLADCEIEELRQALSRGVRAEPHRYMTTGQRVQIKNGPLAGCKGILVRRKGNWRIVICVDLIQRSICVDIDECDVRPLIP